MCAGVGKSGSPAPKPITCSPAACNALAFASTARVAEGATAAARREIRRSSVGDFVVVTPAMLAYVPDVPDITIPPELLPSDGRFGSGPSKVRPASVDALAAVATTYMGTSHRQKTVKAQVGRVRAGMRQLFSLPDGYEVVLGNGGTTCFWDAATFGLIEEQSQHLSFGEFSSKFAACAKAAPHLKDPQVITSEVGTHPTPVADAGGRPVRPDPQRDLDGRVDADPAAGGCGQPRRRRRTGGGGRHLGRRRPPGRRGRVRRLLPGPAEVLRRRRRPLDRPAVARPHSSGSSASPPPGRWIPTFFDLKTAVDNSVLDQTYNTPALATIFLLAEQLDWMNDNGGLEWTASRCDRSAEILYTWAEQSGFARPFVENPADRSHVVGTIDFVDAVDAAAVAAVLRANGIVDTEPYRKLGRNQLRIAMFPAIEPDDVASLCACITHVVGALA